MCAVRRIRLVLLVLVLGLAGCGGAEPAAAPPGIVLPPRPFDVELAGVEPCSLLTAAQRARLGLTQPPRPDRASTTLYGPTQPECTVRGFEPRAISVGWLLVSGTGIERWTQGPIRAAALEPIEVAGFPALRAVPEFPEYCNVVIDVGPGRLVDVQFADGGRMPRIPQEQLCRDVVTVAEEVMSTLLAR